MIPEDAAEVLDRIGEITGLNAYGEQEDLIVAVEVGALKALIRAAERGLDVTEGVKDSGDLEGPAAEPQYVAPNARDRDARGWLVLVRALNGIDTISRVEVSTELDQYDGVVHTVKVVGW